MLPFYRNMENFWNGNADYRNNADVALKTLNTLNNYWHRYDAFSLKGRAVVPSETWMYCDTDHSPTVKSYYPDPENNHGVSGGNVGFCDGSVRWIRREDYVYSHELSQRQVACSTWPIFLPMANTESIENTANDSCVILVPACEFIERHCEKALPALEERGFEVRRAFGQSVIS